MEAAAPARAVKFPDICEWYTPERVAAEEVVWAEGRHYLENAWRINAICHEFNLESVAEFGCGTGWLPNYLLSTVVYRGGIDANPSMLALARTKSSERFIQMNLRDVTPTTLNADLVVSFAVLKHFSLIEWPDILQRILANGRYGLFTQHVAPDAMGAFDDGREWHSSWPTHSDVHRAITAAGHKVIGWDASHIDLGASGYPEVYITTKRVSEVR